MPTLRPKTGRCPAPGRSHNRPAAAFSFIELIVVITVVVILAVVTVPMFASMTEQRLRRASHELAMHLKLARDLAVATRRHTWVDFDAANEIYRVYIEDPNTPGRANRIWVPDPVTGSSQLQVTLNQGIWAGVTITTATFGTRTEVEFDRLGQPYDGLGNLLTSDGTVLLAGGGRSTTVRVVASTGFVCQE